MINIIFLLISLILASVAFCYGAYFLFTKKKPLYFQLLTCAAGCFMLEVLFITIATWCHNYNPLINLGVIGFFGCNFFLLSANYGQLDTIVDDGKVIDAKTKTIAMIAPAIIAIVLVFFIFIIIKARSLASLAIVAMMIPACPASFYNVKHLVMPIDSFGFLKGTKICNISALSFYLVSLVYIFGILTKAVNIQGIALIAMSVSMLLLSVYSVKGARQWAI